MGRVPSSYQNHFFFENPLCFSPSWHWLPTCAFHWRNGNLHLGGADKLHEWVSPLRTGVHTATFPCVSVSAMWAFLPVGSDVCLVLRIICEHGLLFFFFYQLVLTPG